MNRPKEQRIIDHCSEQVVKEWPIDWLLAGLSDITVTDGGRRERWCPAVSLITPRGDGFCKPGTSLDLETECKEVGDRRSEYVGVCLLGEHRPVGM